MRTPRFRAMVLLAVTGSLVGSNVVAEDPATDFALTSSALPLDSASHTSTRSKPANRPSLPPIRDLLDVTAMSTAFVAVDQDGRVVRDLKVDEVSVVEDGSPARILSLEQRNPAAGPSATPARFVRGDPGSEDGQRVVVYVSAALGDRLLFRSLGQQMQAETGRLTALGPVDVVLAHPQPVAFTTGERRPQEVWIALQRALSEASGGLSVARIRDGFAREFKPGAGFENARLHNSLSPGGVVVKARDAMRRERLLIHDALEQMVVWMQNQPPVRGGVLIWITNGFDLNPAEFYVPMVGQIDPFVARTLRSAADSYRLNNDLQWVVETALSLGWTVVPVTCGGKRFVFGADIDAGGGVGVNAKQSVAPFASHGAEFATENPHRPLNIIADATGGHVVANERELAAAVKHLDAAYVVSYQVDRPLDGRLHEIEIRCSRRGVKICCGRHSSVSGTPRGVAMGRALRLLSGEPIAGERALSAQVVNVARKKQGKQVGDLVVTTDLGGLKTALSPLGLGRMRVTVVVEMVGGAPFVHHEEIPLDWRQVDDVWRYTARLDWPKRARNLAVVAEELVSATWGATTIHLR